MRTHLGSAILGAALTAIVSTVVINAMNDTATLTAEYWRQWVAGDIAHNAEQDAALAACMVKQR
jgi:integral membrane sensor domain MASE1